METRIEDLGDAIDDVDDVENMWEVLMYLSIFFFSTTVYT